MNPSALRRVSDGPNSMPLSSSPFSVLHTSGRPCWIFPYPRDILKPVFDRLGIKTFPSVSLYGVRNSLMVQRVSSTPSRALLKHTSSCVYSSLSPPPIHTTEITHLYSRSPLVLPGARLRFILPFGGWESKTNTNKLFEQYDVQKNVDILHQVVTEARARRQRGEIGTAGGGGSGADTWRADLQPRAAVRARTIPTLERERDSLRARLAEVRFFGHLPPSPPHTSGSDHLLNLCAHLGFSATYANVDGEGKCGALPGGAGECGGAEPCGWQDG